MRSGSHEPVRAQKDCSWKSFSCLQQDALNVPVSDLKPVIFEPKSSAVMQHCWSEFPRKGKKSTSIFIYLFIFVVKLSTGSFIIPLYAFAFVIHPERTEEYRCSTNSRLPNYWFIFLSLDMRLSKKAAASGREAPRLPPSRSRSL